jgi:cyclic pyranopterin phosphate synthase
VVASKASGEKEGRIMAAERAAVSPADGGLTHVDAAGRARMVDVGEKAVTSRRAAAEARVRISPELHAKIAANTLAKGNLLEVARLAGIQAAKRTDELIPLCHSLPLDVVEVRAELRVDHVYVWAEAKTTARTGVEMEALTAAAVAALTVIDMGKAVDKGMVVEGLRVVLKEGGRSGTYVAPGSGGGGAS